MPRQRRLTVVEKHYRNVWPDAKVFVRQPDRTLPAYAALAPAAPRSEIRTVQVQLLIYPRRGRQEKNFYFFTPVYSQNGGPVVPLVPPNIIRFHQFRRTILPPDDEENLYGQTGPVHGFHLLLQQNPRMRAFGGRNAAVLSSLSAFGAPDDLDARSTRPHRANARTGSVNPSADPAGGAARLGLG